MHENRAITLYKWILREFTVAERADFVDYLRPHLAALVHPGCVALDLCCGAGPFSFLLEEQGANVTAIDFAPYMIELARQEASKRNSAVRFVLGDVPIDDLGLEQNDLVVFLGNTVSDLPLHDFVKLICRVHTALRHKGIFVIHYVDGLYPFIQETYPREAVQQETPEQITRRFQRYLPEEAAYIERYTNENTGEVYDYTSYVYTAPVVRLATKEWFTLEQSVRLSEQSVLEIYRKLTSDSERRLSP